MLSRQPSTSCVVLPFAPRGAVDAHARERPWRSFPFAAGILLGLGVGGCFEGIVLQQILQWHHVLTSAGYPADSVGNLRVNGLWDGVFGLAAWAFVAAGVVVFWRAAQRRRASWSTRLLGGTMLIGCGAFNLVEGIVDHHLLGLHHVNETVPHGQWPAWDLGFLAWGALMLVGGWLLVRSARARTAGPRQVAVANRNVANATPKRR